MRFMSLFFFSFKTGFHNVALASLKLTMPTRLVSNLQQSFDHCILSAESMGVHYYTNL